MATGQYDVNKTKTVHHSDKNINNNNINNLTLFVSNSDYIKYYMKMRFQKKGK